MTGTTVTRRLVGSAWPAHFNKVIAETQQREIERVGMAEWSEGTTLLLSPCTKEIAAKRRD